MEKYKICPLCGKQNPPKMLECLQCEADLSSVRVTVEEPIQKEKEEKSIEGATIAAGDFIVATDMPPNIVRGRFLENQGNQGTGRMVRICDCGAHNPANVRKCEACGEDISDVIPTPENVPDSGVEMQTTEILRTTGIVASLGDSDAASNLNGSVSFGGMSVATNESPLAIVAPSMKKETFILTALDGTYSYELHGGSVVVGREGAMKEYLAKKPYVSRKHAELMQEDGHLYIQNLSQTNYTYVNNVRIPEGRCELKSGDEIGLGGNEQNGSRQKEAAYFMVRL